MATKTNGEIIKDGLWHNNPALVQVLGLCPLLAVTSTVVNAIGLGIATLLVLIGSNLSVSVIRNFVSESVRLPAFVMIIASFVTCAELLMQAFTYELYEILGIFIPLIVTNCAILGRADAFASKNPPLPAILDGAMMGLGFLAVLVVLGGMRELLGQGTLFADMHLPERTPESGRAGGRHHRQQTGPGNRQHFLKLISSSYEQTETHRDIYPPAGCQPQPDHGA